MRYKYFTFLIALLFCFSFVGAVPPVTTEFIGSVGLDVEANVQTYYKINEAAQIHIFVFNKSNGAIMTNATVSCVVELTDHNGTVVLAGSPTAEDNHFHMSRPANIVTETGIYGLTIVCNTSSFAGYKTAFFQATENGLEPPTNTIVVCFSLFFLALLGWLLITMLLNFARMIQLDTDVIDVGYSLVGYLSLFGFYYFAQTFFPKVLVLDVSLILIKMGAFTHVLIPMIALVLSMTIGQLNKKNQQLQDFGIRGR